mmetsp:Transcript_8903/g.15712  ORF Transcript_8903/g.15712 Transcript_8903/m.15712 type:complete len:247 (-) Transcript_8903:209-949(-)
MPQVHEQDTGRRVRLYVFDFDQTLTVFHVFKTLAGWPKGDGSLCIPEPFATSELGQACRVEELSKTDFKEAGGFASIAFGGPERVEQVRSMLNFLKENGAVLMICSKGLVGTVQLCLSDLGLLSYFTQVYGHIGETYGTTDYDLQVSKASSAARLLGTPDQALLGSKDKLVAALMSKRGLQPSEAVLVEDDPEEIRKARKICRTFFVKAACGLTPEQMALLMKMSDDDSMQSSAQGVGSKRGCNIM